MPEKMCIFDALNSLKMRVCEELNMSVIRLNLNSHIADSFISFILSHFDKACFTHSHGCKHAGISIHSP